MSDTASFSNLSASLWIEIMGFGAFGDTPLSKLNTERRIQKAVKTLCFESLDPITGNISIAVQSRISSAIKGGFFSPEPTSIRGAAVRSVLNVVRADIHAKMAARKR